MRGLMIFLVCCVILLSQMVSSQRACGNVGTQRDTALTATKDTRFVLNTIDMAACNGTVSSYRYCFYPPNETSTNQQGSFTSAIYRLNATTNVYFKVQNSEVVSQHGTSTMEFTCMEVRLPNPITVERGDVFGACVSSAISNTERLDVVGMDDDSNARYLLVANNACQDTVPYSIQMGNLTNVSGLVLHLHAEILEHSTGRLTSGEIAAIVVPILVALLVIALVIVYWSCCRKLYKKKSDAGEQERLVSQQASALNFDNIGYMDVASAQRAVGMGGNPRTVTIESGTYEAVDATPTSILTPAATDSDSTNQSSAIEARLDSGSYAQVRTSPRHRPSSRVRETRQEITDSHVYEPVQRPIYEFESSRSRGVSFECSFDNVNHYEPVHPATGTEYLEPVDQQLSITQLLEMNKEENIYSNVNPYQRPASKEEELLTQLKSWGISRLAEDEIEVQSELGMGQFGTVRQGIWNERDHSILVALKSLNKGSTVGDKVKFLQEAAIMAQFRHPNITMLYGVVVESQPMMLVVELAEQGDLRNYLMNIRPQPSKSPPKGLVTRLLQFSQQVALGMQYLSAKGFVHRDLAARNILVSKKHVCKVADFGLSRDLADESYYVSHGKDKIPVKWTAPEAIHYKKYSTASDVWSYGCLLYEIWSMGTKPFESVTNIQALRLVESGKRLAPPPGCPRMIYELMILCWHPETSIRPSFRDIVLTLIGSEEMVLNIPEEDSSTNPLAGVLGGPLEAGENMYSELQRRYLD